MAARGGDGRGTTTEGSMPKPRRTRLVALGFMDETVAWTTLEEIKAAISRKDIEVEDWALIRKDGEGKVSFVTDKSADPGAARGALFGGAAGMVLAAISGPIGVGAVVAGTAIGAVTAALKDSGFKNDDLESISRLMTRGRSGILLAIPLEAADRFHHFEQVNVLPATADTHYQVDIVPGRTFEQALEAYRAQEDA
jgi:uncharacterized membrane protein